MSEVKTKQKPRKRQYTKDLTAFVGLRLTEAEKRTLEDRASDLGLSLSNYIRDHFIHIKEETGRIDGPARGAPDDT